MEIGPIPFTPDGDMKNDLLEITMNVPSSKTFTLSIYSFDGRKIREFTGPVREKYLWDGREMMEERSQDHSLLLPTRHPDKLFC